MSDNNHDLEARLHRLSESRRKSALETVPLKLLPSVLENAPVPIILYHGNEITYVNPAAIKIFGYTFEEMLTFNDVTLDTGKRKERLDKILRPCAEQNWNDLDLELIIPTLDKKELRLEPHMHREVVLGQDYWVLYIMHAKKIYPQSLTGKAKTWIQKLQHVFQRDIVYVPTPETVTEEFMKQILRAVAATPETRNIVIDFRKTLAIDNQALNILTAYSESFRDQVFLINTDEQLYRLLTHRRVLNSTLYRARTMQFSNTIA